MTTRYISALQEFKLRTDTPARKWIPGVKAAFKLRVPAIVVLDGVTYRRRRRLGKGDGLDCLTRHELNKKIVRDKMRP